MSVRFAIAALVWLMGASAVAAGQTVAVFPFDLVFPQREEDFFVAERQPSADEQRRLVVTREELAKQFTSGGRFEQVDLGGIAADIQNAAPIYNCNGCELDLAKKAGAKLALTTVIEMSSDTLLNMKVSLIDVDKGAVAQTASAVIQGNTDESWLHAVRWLVKNRLLAPGASQ